MQAAGRRVRLQSCHGSGQAWHWILVSSFRAFAVYAADVISVRGRFHSLPSSSTNASAATTQQLCAQRAQSLASSFFAHQHASRPNPFETTVGTATSSQFGRDSDATARLAFRVRSG